MSVHIYIVQFFKSISTTFGSLPNAGVNISHIPSTCLPHIWVTRIFFPKYVSNSISVIKNHLFSTLCKCNFFRLFNILISEFLYFIKYVNAFLYFSTRFLSLSVITFNRVKSELCLKSAILTFLANLLFFTFEIYSK